MASAATGAASAPPRQPQPSPREAALRARLVDAALLVLVFSGAASFSSVLSTLWPYMESLRIPFAFLGPLAAAYPAGFVVGAPLLSLLSTRASTAAVLQASLALAAAGHALYFVAHDCPQPRVVLLAARMLCGLSAGSIALVRTFVSSSTADARRRSDKLTLITSVQGAAYVLGPAFTGGFALAHGDRGAFALNARTMPGLFGIALTLASSLLLAAATRRAPELRLTAKGLGTIRDRSFVNLAAGEDPLLATPKVAADGSFLVGQRSRDSRDGVGAGRDDEGSRASGELLLGAQSAGQEAEAEAEAETEAEAWYSEQQQRSRRVGAALCYTCVLGLSLSFTVVETLITPYAQAAFDWSIPRTSALFAALGALSLGVQAALTLRRRASDAALVAAGLALQVAAMASFVGYREGFAPLWQFLLACALLTVGFSLSNPLVFAVFAACFRPAELPLHMGTFTAAAGLGRIVAPLAATPVFRRSFGLWVFFPLGALLLFAVLLPVLALFPHFNRRPWHAARDAPVVGTAAAAAAAAAAAVAAEDDGIH